MPADELHQGRDVPTSRQRLLTARIIWGSLLMGELMFLVVILTAHPSVPQVEDQARTLGYVSVAMLLVITPVAFGLRRIIRGPQSDNGTFDPQKSMVALIVFLALFEGASFLGLVTFMLGQALGLIVAAVGMAIQALSFPTASAIGEG